MQVRRALNRFHAKRRRLEAPVNPHYRQLSLGPSGRDATVNPVETYFNDMFDLLMPLIPVVRWRRL
jgi:hypothetical protein